MIPAGLSDVANGDSRIVALIRDGLLAGVGLLMCWAVFQLHELSNRVTAIESSRYTMTDGMTAERRTTEQLNSLRHEFVESMQQIQQDISAMRGDLATIKGALAEKDRIGR